MELPHLGKHCALKQCNRLDFLPVKCDACSQVFCLQHYQYDTHKCDKAKDRNVQVPACPLCSEPVVGKRNELPDVAVSQHIDQYCKRNESIKNRPKQNSNLQACNYKSCKQKDLIYLECKDCCKRFCIKHRHPTDHLCTGPSMAANLADNWNSFKGSCSSNALTGFDLIKNKAQQISKSGQAAINRIASSGRHTNTTVDSGASSTRLSNRDVMNNLQGNLSEQEALNRALSESRATNGTVAAPTSLSAFQQDEDEDRALAKAIHESQIEARNRGQRSQQASGSKDNCVLS